MYTYIHTEGSQYAFMYIYIYIYIYISADLFQSSSVLAYNCNPPTPSCRLQPHHPANCILLCCRLQDTAYFVPS